mmetsp:Transcript_26825/g.62883  ORF Transcript_26825/g.62883 Transcript_26825/m.62883 type:complete len:106 (-) Transcript_26825:1384-1701(-)
MHLISKIGPDKNNRKQRTARRKLHHGPINQHHSFSCLPTTILKSDRSPQIADVSHELPVTKRIFLILLDFQFDRSQSPWQEPNTQATTQTSYCCSFASLLGMLNT